MTEVRKKIYQLGSTIDGLSGKFYFVEAPQQVSRPYSVFSYFGNPASSDSASKFEELYLQINHYGPDLAALELIEKKSRSIFEDSESSFGDLIEYHLDRIDRIGTPRKTKLDGVWQITEQYKLELTKL